MIYVLLWVEVLVACLLWVALLVGFLMHIRRNWLKGVLRITGVAIPFLVLSALVLGAGYMRFSALLEGNWFDYMLSLWLAFVIGTVTLFYLAGRRAGEVAAAANWPRGALLAALVASIAFIGMTFWIIDLAFHARVNRLAINAQTRWIAEEPALVSDAQNAATVYGNILPGLADLPDDIKNPPIGLNDSFDPKEPATISFLNGQIGTLAQLRQAAAIPICRFDEDLQTPDFRKLLTPLNEFRNAANLLSLDARFELAHGHVTPAIADVVAIFGMSRQVAQQPFLISGLVAYGMDALGVDQLQEALPYIGRTEDLAGLNLAALATPRRNLRGSIDSEECLGLAWIGNDKAEFLLTGQATSLVCAAGIPDIPLIRLLILSTGLDEYVDLTNRILQSLDRPYFDADPELNELLDSSSPDRTHKGIFTSILGPFLGPIQTAAKAEAGDDCAQVAVAATRYRLDHGSLPAHLNDLIPNYLDEIPLDPFDGHPLRLVVKNDRWIVYSVGPDGVDDGGVSIEEDYPNRQKGDLIFTLKLTPPMTTQP